MAGRAMGTLARAVAGARQMSTSASAQPAAPWKRVAGALGIVGAGATGALVYGECLPVMAEEEFVHPTPMPWEHRKSYFSTFDHASIRRGYEVYRQVCAACHSMDRIAFRNLQDVIYSEAEVKELAAEFDVKNAEPNEDGDMFTRSGKPFDYFPPPYENEQQSRKANGGALPPDLSVITKARHGNEDYIFALLTGYCDPPAGVALGENQHYNPYFPGGKIGMQAPLYDEIIEYSDGTPATTSQLAKDVSTFLCWAAEPEHDERKRMGMKAMVYLTILGAFAYYFKRVKWSVLKTRQVAYVKGSKY